MHNIRSVHEAIDIRRCYPVITQLRPHLEEDLFCEQVQRQIATQHYHLATLESGGEVIAIAGFRYVENLVIGKHLYLDDLVCDEARRGKGFGGRLFDWVLEEARREGCREIHLDSGIERFAAHRFYLLKSMRVTARHFGLTLESAGAIAHYGQARTATFSGHA